MNQSELLARNQRREKQETARLLLERQIISRLPHGPNYLRVKTGDGPTVANAEHALAVEIEVAAFEGALALMTNYPAFYPLPLTMVTYQRDPERGGMPTTSFRPTERIMRDTESADRVLLQIAPALLQVQPEKSGMSWRPKVYLEWYVLLGQRIVNVRAIIANQRGIYYDLPYTGYQHDWRVMGLPVGLERRSRNAGHKAPPFVTIYWPEDSDVAEILCPHSAKSGNNESEVGR